MGDNGSQLDLSVPDHFDDLGIVDRAAPQRSLDLDLSKHQPGRIDRDIMMCVSDLAMTAAGFDRIGR